MAVTTIICIMLSVVLGIMLWGSYLMNRKMAAEMKSQKEANAELLKRIPVTKSAPKGPDPLTLDRIADAVRFNGYVPEKREDSVTFRVQGENYQVDAERLPLLFVVKGYNVDPAEWEMDLLREAAHTMSDQLVMVKATFSDDGKVLRFFVAAQDRNYESLRDNLPSYVRIIADGQRLMHEEYERMVGEKRDAALAAQPAFPVAKTDNKVLS